MKSFTVPKPLQEFHGTTMTWLELLLTYGTGLLVVLLLLLFPPQELQGLESWKQFILIVLLVDICGGVIANLTRSTTRYYQSDRLRLTFILIHVIHPLLLYLIYPNEQGVLLFLWIYTTLAALLVNSLKDAENQRIIAAFFGIIGVFTLTVLFHPPSLLLFLSIAFLLKISYSFAVRVKA